MAETIESCLDRKQFASALKAFATVELNNDENSLLGLSSCPIDESFYAKYMICFLLEADLNGAKYLWKRAPENFKESCSGGDFVRIWEIGKALWADDVTGSLSMLSKDWSPSIVGLVATLKETIIASYFALVAKAYQVIQIDRLAKLLLISNEEAIQRAESLHWKTDISSGIFYPLVLAKTIDDAFLGNENVALMERVTRFAAHFEKQPIKVDLSKPSTSSSSSSSGQASELASASTIN
mmetsp:Transcript_1639/g.2782  ORF Transcript_1639/g.2782 Transcript_1639/m.2782 type:complete len:239 (+) Transcript_1639:122-838(+)